ncbi:aldehyde dehydrogenase family protein [Sphaerobacter sp.]|uniref:aldehyde dehydrogenase family protein n=1 Tax=Sphaerobacter sp. TaxID=2099654 RepID=UPI001D94E902|nr:aldehyde dehydrogenase family protein [Sphaerobacter sp.]MBX5443761.1 aldehyde dehydrogenase family protein [Sphaerobacter sp.]
MAKEYRFYCAGEWRSSDQPLDVINPYNGEVVGTTSFATDQDLEDAITAAERAFDETRRLQSYERAAILERLADGLEARQEEFARLMAQEAGKPIRDARTEVARGVFTLRTAVEEAKRIGGELIPLDWMASSQGRFGVTRRFPIGPIAGISPFNFPLNLALHKLAPAIASGNTIVLKPPTHDPLTMLTFAELVDEAGLPKGAVSIMPMDRTVGDRLVTDPRFKMLSFTGSPAVGWDMKARAGKKKVVLELGGNAGVVVDKSANLPLAVSRVRVGAFAYAGQVCISVQRVYVHRSRFDEFVEKFVAAVKEIKIGDPLDEATELGPMIDEKAAARTEDWVNTAVSEGARVLIGGKAEGRFFQPTVLVDVPPKSFVCSREAFAPLVNLFPFDDFEEALAAVNDSEYGLQAGVFTNRLEHALRAWEVLEVGGVIINDIPTYRIDHMPYGGVKDSGLSREGLRYAIEDMTEPRLMVVNRVPDED